MDAIQILQQCSVEGHIVKLPDVKLERKLYEDVAKRLQGIGGKWKGGKTQGFVFDFDPAERLAQIQGGEVTNLKKEYQFFETPPELAAELVEDADIREGMTVLEPSAGRGALIEAIYRTFPRHMEGPNDPPSVTVDYYELMDVNREILSRKIQSDRRWSSSTSCMGSDFLSAANILYDRIVANPPFSGNQDIAHIYVMYSLLKPGGRLVTLASRHWQLSSNRVEREFRAFLKRVDASVLDVDAGTFRQSGTNVATVKIIIDKPY